MKHPDEATLALYAGGDLPLWRRWLVAWHVRRCESCRRTAEFYREDSLGIASAGSTLPTDLEWNLMALDMRANIQVGLQAGECVAPARPHEPRLGWRPAAALASVAVVIVGGWWWLHLPNSGGGYLAENVVLAATSDGIELVSDEGRRLTLKHASSEPVMVSVHVDGMMEAHYVDDETGMVTINNVYVP